MLLIAVYAPAPLQFSSRQSALRAVDDWRRHAVRFTASSKHGGGMAHKVTVDLDKLHEDIATARRHLDQLVAFEKYLSGLEQPAEPDPAVQESYATANGFRLPPTTASHDAAAAVMRRAGRPMRVAEIVSAVQAAGYGTGLSNPGNALYTSMTRKPGMFERLPDATWRLRESED
jgi:hypothetical protein